MTILEASFATTVGRISRASLHRDFRRLSFTLLFMGPVAPAIAQGLRASAAACDDTSGLFMIPILAACAIAAAAVAFALDSRIKGIRRHLARQKVQIEVAETSQAELRAINAIEPQCCVVWSEATPKIVLNSLPAAAGVPSKLTQLLRFSSWLDPEDAGSVAGKLEHLTRDGTAFVVTASPIEGQVVEIAGSVYGANAVLRIRLFSPVNKELVRLIGENRKLQIALADRDALLEFLPIPMWLRNKQGAITWVNPAYVNAVNAKSRSSVVEDQVELFEARQRAALSKLNQTKKAGRLRLQTVIDGNVRLYEAITAPLSRGTAGAALDVAPLTTAKDELDRQMAAHSRTLDKVSTGIAMFSAERRLVYTNEALARIWSLEEDRLKEKPLASEFFDLLRNARRLPEQANYRRWRDESILAWDRNRTLDEFWYLPDGRALHVLTDYRDDGGVTFLFEDVTERLALERQFHSLIEVQRETLDHLNEGIAVFGTDGRLQLFNPAFKAIWNIDESGLTGKPHLDQIIGFAKNTVPDEAFWAPIRDAITGLPEGRDLFTGTIERRDNIHLAYACTPLPDGGALLTFSDITDTKRIEVVLMERNEALEAADRLKTAFLSHVSYELRTPLTSIIGFTDLLAGEHIGPLTNKQQEYLGDIKTSSQVLLTIINDILDLAVIDAGALDLKLAPAPIKEIVEAAELGVRDRLSRMKVTLDVHIGDGAATVNGDANRLTQVVYNLLSNAIGFSPEGGTITLSSRREKNGVSLSVQDTGLGIPEEEQSRVFDRFQARAHGSRHRGAGLGLSLVKSIVELHSGKINLRSTPGAGTTVTVFLPDRHPALNRTAPPRSEASNVVASSHP